MLTTCVVIGPPVRAAEIADRLQATGVLAGGYQYADSVRPAGVENRDGYAVPFQLELAYLPTALSEFSVKLGFASGNGLNAKSEVTLAPWAADLEADVTHINGRDRSYLLGAWIRFGWQESSAAIDHAHIYSGGLDLGGRLWGRDADNLGFAYAHLGNGNLEIERTDVIETYLRFALGGGLDVTADLQYVRDTYAASDNREVFIYGLRLAAFF